jgi:hypothetical protein
MPEFMEKNFIHTDNTSQQEGNSTEIIEDIVLTYPDDTLNLLQNYEKYGVLYHGTSSTTLSREVLPPNVTQVISERGRKKNLNQVFLTRDYKSASIYAQRAMSSMGGGSKNSSSYTYG